MKVITSPKGRAAARTLYVERLLLVGSEAGGRWALWVEGLVLTGAGWRMLPWVPYEDAVEAPRRCRSSRAESSRPASATSSWASARNSSRARPGTRLGGPLTASWDPGGAGAARRGARRG